MWKIVERNVPDFAGAAGPNKIQIVRVNENFNIAKLLYVLLQNYDVCVSVQIYTLWKHQGFLKGLK